MLVDKLQARVPCETADVRYQIRKKGWGDGGWQCRGAGEQRCIVDRAAQAGARACCCRLCGALPSLCLQGQPPSMAPPHPPLIPGIHPPVEGQALAELIPQDERADCRGSTGEHSVQSRGGAVGPQRRGQCSAPGWCQQPSNWWGPLVEHAALAQRVCRLRGHGGPRRRQQQQHRGAAPTCQQR
jgi:hypothetical protein